MRCPSKQISSLKARKKVQAWITVEECLKRFPDWKGYTWLVNGQPMIDPVISLYGGAQDRVYLKDGQPWHDKLNYFEAPNQNNVVWDKDEHGNFIIGCTIEERGFADMPGSTIQEVIPADPPMLFFQPCVMGFFNKVLGKDLGDKLKPALETGEEASIRESLEEFGVTEIRSIESMGVVWPNATNTPTVTHLFDMWVDKDKIVQNPAGREWSIKDCVWLSIREVLARIAAGSHNEVNCRMGQANTTFFTWLCRHPEAFAQATN